MKNLKSIFVIALALISFSVAKADDYTDCVKTLIQNNVTSFDAEFGQNILEQSGIDMTSFSQDDIAECLAEAMVPYYKKYLSEAEMKEAVKYIQKPEVKAINEKVQQAIEKGSEKSQEKMQPSIMKLMFGETPEDVPMPECDAKYLSAYETFYKSSGIEDLAQTLGGVMGQAMGNVPDDQKEMVSKLISRFTTYLSTNMKPLMLGIMKEELSLSDLQEFNKVNDNDLMRKMNASAKDMVADFAKFSESLSTISSKTIK